MQIGKRHLPETGSGKAVFPDTTSRSIPIKRTSITLDDRVYEAGLEIAAQRGFSQSFSAYIAWLIQRDAAGGVTREEAPKASKAPKAKAVKAAPKAAPKAKATARPKAAKAKAPAVARKSPKAPTARKRTKASR